MFHKAVCVLQTAACWEALHVLRMTCVLRAPCFLQGPVFAKRHGLKLHGLFLALCVYKAHVLEPHGLFLALCVYKAPRSKAPWFVPCAMCL